MITPGIIKLLLESRKLSIEEASDILYSSHLYKTLEDEKGLMAFAAAQSWGADQIFTQILDNEAGS